MTAAEANKLTEEAKEKQIPARREKILEAIKTAAIQGRSHLSFSLILAEKEDYDYLRDLGYTVDISEATGYSFIQGSVSW